MAYIQTVLGKINPNDMGFTLPHEHLLWDLTKHWSAKDLKENDKRLKPLSMENIGDLKYHLWEYKDNMSQLNVETAIEEVNFFKKSGGLTICDNTCFGERDVLALQEISRKTGVNVILGTGTYTELHMSEKQKNMSPEELANTFINEIENGVKDTGVKCGFIGEIGLDYEMPETSVLSVTAAAIAQKKTKTAILIHQCGNNKQADKVFDIIVKNGGDLSKVIMCHCDPFLPDYEYLDFIVKSGANFSLDFFGLEAILGYTFILPNDKERILAIRNQIDKGHINHIFTSHDIAYKSMLKKFGGHGYSHIKENIFPIMKKLGFLDCELKQITELNPKRVFSIDK